MKRICKSALLLLAALLLVFTQNAGNTIAVETTPRTAAVQPPKEEVVYGVLSASGAVETIYTVNIFSLDAPATVQDYGNYTTVQNLTGTAAPRQQGESVQIDAETGKLYYQGVMEGAVLPWDVSLRYALDGAAVSPAELAGRSGRLEIQISITQNTNAAASFYEGCALQVSVTLDTALCSNIEAPGATIANAGQNKQVNYTALPGKGLSATIRADVHDFEMDRVSINGLGLALDFDINTDEFTDSFVGLQDAIDELNGGAGEIRDALKELYNGAGKLRNGAAELADGLVEFDTGIAELQAGVEEYRDGVWKLYAGTAEFQDGMYQLRTGAYELVDGSAQIKQGIDSMATQLAAADLSVLGNLGALVSSLNPAALNGLIAANESMITAYGSTIGNEALVGILTQNNAVLGGLVSGLPSADDLAALSGLSSMATGLTTFQTEYTKFHNGLAEYAAGVAEAEQGFWELRNGILELAKGADELYNGIVELKDGSFDVVDGAKEFEDGILEFRRGIKKLYDGAIEYSDGTQQFYDETISLDTEVDTQVNDMLAEMLGDDVPLVSFASPRNTNIRSVQFVLAAEAIRLPESEAQPADAPAQRTVFEKFLDLFR